MVKEDLTGKKKTPSDETVKKDLFWVILIIVSYTVLLLVVLGVHTYHVSSNKKLEKIIASLMAQVFDNKVDFLKLDVKSVNVRIRLDEEITTLRERVKKNELELKLNKRLHKLMMDTDQSILDASNASIEVLQKSIELGNFYEYLETYNNIKVVPKKVEE
jgi:hypothetical protein